MVALQSLVSQAPPPAVRESLGGAASRRLEELLTAPAEAAEVSGAFTQAIYLATGDGVVAIVARDALRLPIAVVVAPPASARPFDGLTNGQPAMVGDGRVIAGDVRIDVASWWTPRRAPALVRPEHLAARAARLARALHGPRRALSPVIADRLGRLTTALLCGDHPGASARSLVGLGEGLTPTGDDILAGVLLALRQLGRPAGAEQLWASITEVVPERTTALSAALLAAAAAGDAIPPAVGVLAALSGHRPVEPAVDRLVAVGANSGADLAHGLLAGTRAAVAHRDRRPLG